MTTLAAELVADNRHMRKVRAEYDLTVIDHAFEDGCDRCGVGLDPRRPSSWEFHKETNRLLCPPCVAEVSRYTKQLTGMAPRTPAVPKDECNFGHKMTEANTYVYRAPDGRTRNRCRACGLRRNTEYRAKQKAVAS